MSATSEPVAILEEPKPEPMILIALSDAARNCADNYDARVTITLRSGIQFTGRLERDNIGYDRTAMLKTDGGGWTTLLTLEVAAVASHWKQGRR